MRYVFNCFEGIHKYAIKEFNNSREDIEKMHQSKINVIKMYWCFGYKVLYELKGKTK